MMHPMWMNGLEPEMVTKAEIELGETPETKRKALKQLLVRINDEPDFEPLTDENFLLRFLRVKKYDVKRAFKTLKNYYNYKSKYSGYLTDITPMTFKNVMEENKFMIMPCRDLTGAAVCYFHIGGWNLDAGSVEEFTAAMLTTLELMVEPEATQVCGLNLIVDYSGISLKLFSRFFRPTFLYMSCQAILDTFPLRIKGLQLVHEPSYFTFSFNTLVKPILTRKIRERFFFHGENVENLHKLFPPECLPESLGGKVGKEEFDKFRTEMLSRQKNAERLNKYTFKGKTYPTQLSSLWLSN